VGFCGDYQFRDIYKDLSLKRAFTLIELLVTVIIATIFLNFIFAFYLNTLNEIKYLNREGSLMYNSFRALQIIKYGVGEGNSSIEGVITLRSKLTGSSFISNNENHTVQIGIENGNLTVGNGLNSFTFWGVEVSSVELEHIANGLYLVELNNTQNIFQRLIYTK
jgi:prepilin-type N-terminal cleavage/methylation domain-containing protein